MIRGNIRYVHYAEARQLVAYSYIGRLPRIDYS